MSRETKTVLISITRTEHGMIVQGAVGSPAIVPNGTPEETASAMGRAVNGVMNDPSQPSHQVEAAGFNYQEIFRGVGRLLEGYGKDEPA
jgi:hypothetical protein